MALAAKDRFVDTNLNIPIIMNEGMDKINIKYKEKKLIVIGVFTQDIPPYLIASDEKGNVYRVTISLNLDDLESIWRVIAISSIPPK